MNALFRKSIAIKALLIVTFAFIIAEWQPCNAVGKELKAEMATDSAADLSVTLKQLTNLDHETFIISKDSLQNTGKNLARKIRRLENRLKPYLGSWISIQPITGISVLKILAFCLLLGIVALLDALLKLFIKRRITGEILQRDNTDTKAAEGKINSILAGRDLSEASEFTQSNFNAFLIALKKPLSLFIWIYGIFTGFSFLLSDIGKADEIDWLAITTGKFADIFGFFTFFWFIFRCISLVEIRLSKWAEHESDSWDSILIPFIGKCLRLVIPLMAIILSLPMFELNDGLRKFVIDMTGLAIIASTSWILVQLVSTVEKGIIKRFEAGPSGDLKARKIFTQVHVLKKVILIIIGILTLGSMLMIFDSVRQLGTSILASAGVIGIIVGFSAQKTIAMLLAGLQIALTQPIRLEDVVIVENEWGWIEEITLTYVVVRIWDLRRLVVPINYFIEKPFQNWTRTSSDILGTVSIFADYTIPVDEIRKALKEIVSASPFWDGKTCGVQVTNATERTVEIRALVSAEDSGKAWDLRCEVREKLISFIRNNYPGSLPKFRAENLTAST